METPDSGNAASTPPLRTGLSRLFDAVAFMALTSGGVLLAVEWSRLPEQVPTHFDGAMRVDGWAPKWQLVFLPGIAAAIFFGFQVLFRFPALFNYPWNLTAELRQRLHPLACEMLSCLAMAVAVALFFLLMECIESAKDSGRAPSRLWAPIFFSSLAAVILLYWIRIARARREAMEGG